MFQVDAIGGACNSHSKNEEYLKKFRKARHQLQDPDVDDKILKLIISRLHFAVKEGVVRRVICTPFQMSW
jgi:hypothetical protein